MNNSGQKIGLENFEPMLEIALTSWNFPDIIKNGFRTCGLVPLNSQNIPFCKYFKNSHTSSIENKETNSEDDQITESAEIWKGNPEDKSLWKKPRVHIEPFHITAEDEGHQDNPESTDKIIDITDLIDSETLSLPLIIAELSLTMEHQEPVIYQNATNDIIDNFR